MSETSDQSLTLTDTVRGAIRALEAGESTRALFILKEHTLPILEELKQLADEAKTMQEISHLHSRVGASDA